MCGGDPYSCIETGLAFMRWVRQNVAMTWQYYLTFLSIVLVATLSPGPSMLLALNHGASHGFRASAQSGFGNIVGNLVLALASLASLQSLLLVSRFAFQAIQWGGIAFLIYLGLRIWLSADAEVDWSELGTKSRRSYHRLFWDGFLVAVANPKGLVFYTALFPQFIHFGKASSTEYLWVFSTLIVVGWLGYMLYAVFGSKVRRLFHSPRFRKNFNRVSGAAFVGAGLAMAWTKKV